MGSAQTVLSPTLDEFDNWMRTQKLGFGSHGYFYVLQERRAGDTVFGPDDKPRAYVTANKVPATVP